MHDPRLPGPAGGVSKPAVGYGDGMRNALAGTGNALALPVYVIMQTQS